MKGKLILSAIILYTAISRFFLIDKIPPILTSGIINLRILSATVSLMSTALVFYLIKNYWRNTKIAFLSAWVFANLPWVIEQGRIISQPNFALFLVLALLLIIKIVKLYSNSFTSGPPAGGFAHPRGGFKAYLLYLIIPFIPLIFIFVYPQFWLFKAQEFKFSLSSFITNLFILTSFDFLFFKNITFWWGGIKEFGVMFLSFAPFFVLGIYRLIINKRKIVALLTLITFIAALSPYFPESREFYLTTPIISLAVAWGIYSWSLQKNMLAKIIIIWLFMVMIYEFSQYLHFYYIHYPQEIMSNFPKIHEAF